MSAPPPPPDPRQLLAAAGLRPKKSWGQNFLRDVSALRAIVDAVGAGPEAPVVELGAGLGALTYELLLAGGPVFAVERDRDLMPLLRQALGWADRLELIEADAAGLDYADLARRVGGRLRICGNLPYQLSGRILVSLAGAHSAIARAVVMVQREVGERVVATPGGKDYGLLTVLVQRAFEARRVRRVPAGAFYPRPKVDSAVIALVAHDRMLPPERDAELMRTAKAAFAQRRKTLANALAGGLGLAKSEVVAALENTGIDPKTRAEMLTLEQFAALASSLRQRR